MSKTNTPNGIGFTCNKCGTKTYLMGDALSDPSEQKCVCGEDVSLSWFEYETSIIHVSSTPVRIARKEVDDK